MKTSGNSGDGDKAGTAPEKIFRGVLDACADCDTCRFLMEESCLFFPELYRLYDKEKESGGTVSDKELDKMAALCTLCGLCPCPNIRADIIRGKTELVRRRGLPLANRLLADVQRFGRMCGRFPGLVNALLGTAAINRMAKTIAGVHPGRRLPLFPSEDFFSWAKKQGLRNAKGRAPGAAYFAGCTAGYLFPQVARAAVAVLRHNGISVYVPPQQCCGMPTLLEGDKDTTLQRLGANMDFLLNIAGSGFDIISSCPTCCYLMKVLLREGAYYSEDYQRQAGAGPDEIKVPKKNTGEDGYVYLKKSMYEKILKDDGYFSGFDPLKRIALADTVFNMGDYLDHMLNTGGLNSSFGPVPGNMVNFTSCHQREQGSWNSYMNVLALIPDLSIREVGNSMDCCGMGGSLGFKKDFHDASVGLGEPLLRKIKVAEPEAIVTDCLSCRLQFTQLLPYPVYHPLELIEQSYAAAND